MAHEKWNIPKIIEADELLKERDELATLLYVALFLKGSIIAIPHGM